LNELVRGLFPDQRSDDDNLAAPADTTGLLISMHSYGNLVLWPWGWSAQSAPNESGLRTLGRKLAFFNAYRPGQANELYRTTGDTTDWAYGELGIPAYTYEIGEFFFQPCEDLEQIMSENLDSLVYAAKASRRPYQMPAGPDTMSLRLEPIDPILGEQVLLTAKIDDRLYSHVNGQEPWQDVAGAEYYLDAPPWATPAPLAHSMQPKDGAFDSSWERVEANIDTSGLSSGRHTVFVRGQDSLGNWGVLSAVFFYVEHGWGHRVYLPLTTRVSIAPVLGP
jgi:hypothetical protein